MDALSRYGMVPLDIGRGGELLTCDERHYRRFLRRVLPGPERTQGEWCCDTCGTYFNDDSPTRPSVLAIR